MSNTSFNICTQLNKYKDKEVWRRLFRVEKGLKNLQWKGALYTAKKRMTPEFLKMSSRLSCCSKIEYCLIYVGYCNYLLVLIIQCMCFKRLYAHEQGVQPFTKINNQVQLVNQNLISDSAVEKHLCTINFLRQSLI